jgi:hypothetical protein
MAGTFRIAYITDPYPRRDSLQFAVAVDFTGKAVERMIGEDEFDDIFP